MSDDYNDYVRRARHIVALDGGWGDIAHQLEMDRKAWRENAEKEKREGKKDAPKRNPIPTLQRYLDDEVRRTATGLWNADHTNDPLKRTQAYIRFIEYQRNLSDREFFIARSDVKDLETAMDVLRRAGVTELNPKDGEPLLVEECEPKQVIASAVQTAANYLQRFHDYLVQEGLVVEVRDRLAEKELGTDNGIEQKLAGCTVDQRRLLTTIFGEELIGRYALKRRPRKKRD